MTESAWGKMTRRATLVWLLSATLSAGVVVADEAPTVMLQRLTLETAQRLAQAALAACRERGIQVAVTVVDRNGLVQLSLRDTIAAPVALPISRQKAYTAVNFNAATSALAGRAGTPIGRVEGLLMAAGGLPIEVAGQLLGGVGVSGAPGGETDEACARAGIEAVMDDLELSL